MIEKLQQGEFREAKITEKLNELIDAFNEHYHRTIDSETQGIGIYDNGFRSSTPRVDEGDV